MIFRKILAISAIFLVALLLTGLNLAIVANPEQIELRLRQEFSKYFNANIEFESCEFDLQRGLSIDNMTVRNKQTGSVLLEVHHADFEHNLSSLALGALDLKDIRINATLYIERNDGRFDWLDVLRKFYVDPKIPAKQLEFLRFDSLTADLKIYVKDNLLFKNNEVQEFTATVRVYRNPTEKIQHLISGDLTGPFWGYWNLNGKLEFYRNQMSEIHLVNQTFSVDYRIRNKLTEELQTQFEFLNPQGLVRMDAFVTSQLSNLPNTLQYGLKIHPIGMEMTYFKFPYTLSRLYGGLLCTGKGIELKNLNGVNGKGKFTIDGAITGYQRNPDMQMFINGADLVLDDRFYRALPDKTRKVWDIYSPSGLVDIRARFTQKPGDPIVETFYDVFLKDAHFQYRDFPYRIEHATGRLQIHESHITIDSILMQKNGGTIEIYDTEAWSEHADGEGDVFVNLKIRGENVLIDEEFINAFPEQYRKLWNSFAPSGRIDFDVAICVAPGQAKPEYIIKLSPHSLDFAYHVFPYPLSEVTGTIELQPNKTFIRRIKGWNGQTFVELDGVISYPAPDTLDIDLAINFEDLLVNDSLMKAVNPMLRTTLERLRPEGAFDVSTTLNYSARPAEPSRMHFTGTVDLADQTINAGIRFKDVDGSLRVSGDLIDGQDAVISGSANFTHVDVFGKKFSDFQLQFAYQDMNLEISKIWGRNFGGNFAGFALAHLDPAKDNITYTGKLDLTGMDLSFLSDKLKEENPKGRIDIMLGFHGEGSSPANLVGNGSINIKDAKLWDAPFFVELVNVLTLKITDPKINNTAIDFSIEKEVFNIHDIEFTSPELDLRGRGTMAFDGKLDLSVQASIVPEFTEVIPVLGQLVKFTLDGVMYQAIAVEVKGTISEPKPRIVVLPLLQNPLRFLFGKRK